MKEQIIGFIDALMQTSHDRSWDYIQGWQDAIAKVKDYVKSLDSTPHTYYTPGSPMLPAYRPGEYDWSKGPSDWPPITLCMSNETNKIKVPSYTVDNSDVNW